MPGRTRVPGSEAFYTTGESELEYSLHQFDFQLFPTVELTVVAVVAVIVTMT